MNKNHLSLSLSLGLILLFGVAGCGPDKNSPEGILKDVDAVQAMAIANDWKWSRQEIKSYVTPREVIFELSEKKVKKIPLPEEKMVVALAPYINQTHR